MLDNERAYQYGVQAQADIEADNYDHELVERLGAVDLKYDPIILRLPPRERAALDLAAQIITSYVGIYEDKDSWGRGFLYGFQMGHDYVKEYGPLPEVDTS